MSSTIQSAITVSMAYGKEESQGVRPAGFKLRYLEKVSGMLSLEKDAYSSARVRRDRQKVYSRHGVRRVAGQIRDEISIGASEGLLEGAVGNDWVNGTTKTGAYVIDALGELTGNAGAFNGLFPGLTVEITGLADQEEGADAIVAKIVEINADKSAITVVKRDEEAGPFVDETDAAAVSVKVIGRLLKNGVKDISYYFESHFPEINGTQKFLASTGVKVDQAAIDLPTSGLATVNYTLRGLNQTTEAASADASPLDPVPGSLLAAVNGSLRIGGSKVALITALSFNIANSLSGDAVVGSNFVPKLFEGSCIVTGSFTAYLDSMDFIDAFDKESELSLDSDLIGDDLESFLSVILPRVKVNSATITADGTGGATVAVNFEALGEEELTDATIVFQSTYLGA